MTLGPIGPISEFSQPVSQRALAEIARVAPGLSLGAIQTEFTFYVLQRDADDITAKDIRDEIALISSSIKKLKKRATTMTQATRHWVRQGCYLAHQPAAFDELKSALDNCAAGLTRTLSIIPKGRRSGARTGLVQSLARIIHAAGIEVNARPSGPLVTVTAILLQDAGEAPTDVRKIVSEALSRWKLPASN